GATLNVRIVGPEEIYGEKDYISIDSPMARACIGKAVDEEVIVSLPTGKKVWFVNAIRYEVN
ncbi:MAG: GreA/GreB family elongation factor, partial [Thiomicrorhabdus sp.]|nr:GreA/GreB family elongation factor [Thiomicrorhabdus sp.]